MNKNTFIKQVKELAEYQSTGFKLDDIFNANISCEGFIGKIIDSYGELILKTAAHDRFIPDCFYEDFWEYIVDPSNHTDKDLEQLYEDLRDLK